MLQRFKHWQYKLVFAIALIAAGTWGVQVGQHRSATLLALDTNTGKVRWFQPLRSAKDFYSRGAIAANGTVVLGSAESSTPKQRYDTYRVSTFDAQSGKPQWTTQLNSPVEGVTDSIGYWFASNLEIDLQPTALYAQMGDELRSFDPRTGQQRWAIKRPWLNAKDRSLRFGLGIAATEQLLAVLQLGQDDRQLQVIDAKTGKVLRQTSIAFKPLESTSNRITAGNRLAFLETSGQIRVGDNAFLDNGQSTLTAYDLNTGQVRFRVPITGTINHLQAADKTLQLSTDSVYDFTSNPSKVKTDAYLMGLDLQTGRVLWQRSKKQINCQDFTWSLGVDTESVYLNCDRGQGYRGASTIVALSARTGQTQWETSMSLKSYSEHIPSVIGARQLLTFRRVSQGDRSQTQAIALDRQTGRLLWNVALFNADYVDAFRSQVATDQDKVFVLDALPQWQLWLLRLNQDWYVNPAIGVKL